MKKEKMIIPSLFLFCLLSCSNSMTKTEIILQGKILVSPLQNDTCFIYENSNTAKLSFKERNDKELSYDVMAWLNTKDTFVGMERISGAIPMDDRSNIVLFDLSGKIKDRIYEAEKGEMAWPFYPSRDDKYLMFTSSKNLDPEVYPLEGLDPMVSLAIMDIERKKVIIKMDSFARYSDLKIEESPWLQDGYRFVYSMGRGMQFILQGEEQPINPSKTKGGVYIFDVLTGKHSLLISGGFSAIASPTSNCIAYEKDNSIIVRDMNNNKEQTAYKYKSNEIILNKHWTPDGKAIYLSYRLESGISDVFDKYGQKLIDISSGEKLPFKAVSWMSSGTYTWK